MLTYFIHIPYDCSAWPREKRAALTSVAGVLLKESGVTHKKLGTVWTTTANQDSITVYVETPDTVPEKVCEILNEDAVEKAYQKYLEDQAAQQAAQEARVAEALKIISEVDALFVGMSIDETAKRVAGDDDMMYQYMRRERAYAVMSGRQ